MADVLKRIIAALTKKLLLLAAVVEVWIVGALLPESVTLGIAGMILGLNSGYADRVKYLRAYWTGEPIK
jgi:hypothetical protein